MGNTSGAKYKHMLYNVSWARRKSGEKLQKAIEWYINILKKESKQGETKWTYKTKLQAQARIKKMGISKVQITDALERKGLKDLLSKIA